MPTAHENLIAGYSAQDDTEGMKSLTSVTKVEGITGSATQQARSALNASGVPKIGFGHPSHPELECIGRKADAMGGGVWTVTAQWGRRGRTGASVSASAGSAVISYRAGLRNVTTNKDADGKEILLVCPDMPQGVSPQPGRVTYGVPTRIFVISRREAGPKIDDDYKYHGKTNTGNGFKPGRKQQKENTWRCNNIARTSYDGGKTYDTQYEFEEVPEGWDQVSAFTDPSTGQFPTRLTKAKSTAKERADGTKTVTCYQRVNFNSLKF